MAFVSIKGYSSKCKKELHQWANQDGANSSASLMMRALIQFKIVFINVTKNHFGSLIVVCTQWTKLNQLLNCFSCNLMSSQLCDRSNISC